MINMITKSKIRKNILKLFIFSDIKEYYLSEIANSINASIGSTQREMNRFIDSGLFSSRKVGNLRYYFLDKKDPTFSEIKNIIIKSIGIEEEFKGGISKINGIDYCFILGSYVKKDFNNKSDIDLMVIGKISEDDLLVEINKLEKKFNREINYHIYTKKDFAEKLKKDSFIKNILKKYLLLTDNKNEFKKYIS